jgi:pantoate--beta-alanine ligase
MSEASEIVTTVGQVRRHVREARVAGKTIGLVPTMGALHEGHLTLMRRAREECGFVVVSIFVNPTQFPPGEDFARYPRDLEADARRCAEVGVDLIFAPAVEEIYPPGDATVVEVTGTLVEGMCAAFRPGHFRGVTTVCARLFNIALPDRAYFGEKDYQQLQVIKRMVADLRFPLDIVPVPTVREPEGLAMSSRNAYLSPEERQAATVLSRGLAAARERFAAGEREAAALAQAATEVIAAEPRVRMQYVEVRDAETLAAVARAERPAVIAVAAFVGSARLIDNVVVG